MVTALNMLLIGLLAGAAAGVAVAWALLSARYRVAAAEAARARADSSAATRSELAALHVERDSMMRRLNELTEQSAVAEQRARRAETEAVGANAALDAERTAAMERERVLAHRDSQLKESFQALSADALARNNEAFVTLAEGRLKEVTAALTAKADGDATARAQAINAMLDPMTVTLRRVEGQLHTVEKERESAYAGLREQVTAMHRSSEQLQGETKQLVNALRAPQVRAAGASCSWSGSSSWPAWSSTATSTSRSSPPARTAAPGRTWWCAWPATSRSWWTPRSMSP